MLAAFSLYWWVVWQRDFLRQFSRPTAHMVLQQGGIELTIHHNYSEIWVRENGLFALVSFLTTKYIKLVWAPFSTTSS